MHKKSSASFDKLGYSVEWVLHHSKGFTFSSASLEFQYLDISSFTTGVIVVDSLKFCKNLEGFFVCTIISGNCCSNSFLIGNKISDSFMLEKQYFLYRGSRK